jgi:hypothetical protein
MLESIFVIWTTFVCANGEIANIEKRETGEQRFFSTNLYSSDFYTKSALDKHKDRWREYYTTKRINDPIHCIGFMIQTEDVTDELILREFLGMRRL